MPRQVSEKYFRKLVKLLKHSGGAIARRLGQTRQATNARMRRLGL